MFRCPRTTHRAHMHARNDLNVALWFRAGQPSQHNVELRARRRDFVVTAFSRGRLSRMSAFIQKTLTPTHSMRLAVLSSALLCASLVAACSTDHVTSPADSPPAAGDFQLTRADGNS